MPTAFATVAALMTTTPDGGEPTGAGVVVGVALGEGAGDGEGEGDGDGV